MNSPVYVYAPDLTPFNDSFFKCELLEILSNGKSRLRVDAVHILGGGVLTAADDEYRNKVIVADTGIIFNTIEEMKHKVGNQDE